MDVATTAFPAINRRALVAQLAVVVVLVVAIAAWMVHVHARPLDAKALALPVGDLASHASELALLARLGAHHELPRDIASHHAAQLADAVQDTRGQLDRPAAPSAAAFREQARRVGARTAQDAAALVGAPTDRGVMRRLTADAAAADAVDKALQAAAR
jgi:hypothetical protein